MPFPSMVHDFAVTRNWIIVPNFPLTGSMERAMSGKPPFAWEPDKGTHIAFIPRNGTVADAKWVTAPACYVFHAMNHDEAADGRIVVDVMKYDVAPLFPLPDGSPSTKGDPPSRLFRWTFDLSGKNSSLHGGAARRPGRRVPALRRTLLHGRLPPRLDRVGPRHRRFGRRAAQEGDQLTHYDLKTGKSADWRPGRGDRLRANRFSCRARRRPPKATAGC